MEYYDDNNVEKIFQQDAKEKKRIGNNVRYRASRKGYIRGGVKTQYDYMTRKERKNLNGDVIVYQINEEAIKTLADVPNFKYFRNKSDMDSKKSLVNFIHDKYSVQDLCEHWGVAQTSVRRLFDQYGIARKHSMKSYNGPYKTIEEVPSIQSLRAMPVDQARSVICDIKRSFPAYMLANYWGISEQTYYNYVHKYGVPFAGRQNKKQVIGIVPVQETAVAATEYEDASAETSAVENKEAEPVTVNEPTVNNDKFAIYMNGEFTIEDLKNKLASINVIIDNECTYNSYLSIVNAGHSEDDQFIITLSGKYIGKDIAVKLDLVQNVLNDKEYVVTFSLKEL